MMTPPVRIPLSPPHIDDDEFEVLRQGVVSGEIALGVQVSTFEYEFAAAIGRPHVAAVSSGTAALHLALRVLPVMPDEEVFCATFTSSATANPIRYERAVPVFIDCDSASWGMDPVKLEHALNDRAKRGRLPRAVIVAHVYGQCANIDAIAAICERHSVPFIEDAAESLGAIYYSADSGVPKPAGTRGWMGAYSFGENKIISCSSGGMLTSIATGCTKRWRRRISSHGRYGCQRTNNLCFRIVITSVVKWPRVFSPMAYAYRRVRTWPRVTSRGWWMWCGNAAGGERGR